ncbi:hypothetical protein C2S51_002717 [Perilla frutescens var. frutescens]|nr:hypothetical protein C2S51_002717 [Perilla frutescens var. frutescens]
MGRDFFESLPSEMIVNILSRLPARTAMSCKCVCKLWLDLLVTAEFVKSYLSKVGPCLAVFYQGNSKPYKVVEFLDKLDLKSNEHHWNVVFSFLPPFYEPVHSSANGLLLLRRPCYGSSDLILCNPVTRDYIKLPCPMRPHPKSKVRLENFGLGVSRMSEQFKVVRIFYGLLKTYVSEKLAESDCQVYTVGTGSTNWNEDTGIWLMKEYEEKSWTKEFVIRQTRSYDFHGCLCPIKVYPDGDILMKFNRLLYYSNKTKHIREVDVSGLDPMISDSNRGCPAIYTPSFVTLKDFAMENVSFF